MPRSQLSDKDLSLLIGAVVGDEGRRAVETLLEKCHEYVSPVDPTGKWLMPYERFFRKTLAYCDFDVHIPHFVCNDNTVTEADIQFKRPSRFPSPYWNRNRQLVKKLKELLRQRYPHKGVEVEDENGGRQIHFDVESLPIYWLSSTPFEEWRSECAIYDEPCSSGQTDPEETGIRNDFVIARFRRKKNRAAVQG